MLQVHTIKPAQGSRHTTKRIGRGNASGHGTYSTRGGKGQTARSGHRIRPAIRDYLKQIPKRRGRHKHSFVSVYPKNAVINIGQLEKAFTSGETVSPKTLLAKKLIVAFGSVMPRIKILGSGALKKRFKVQGCAVSESAKKSLEAAGGSIAVGK